VKDSKSSAKFSRDSAQKFSEKPPKFRSEASKAFDKKPRSPFGRNAPKEELFNRFDRGDGGNKALSRDRGKGKSGFDQNKSGFDRKPDFNREKSGFDRKPDFNREKSGFDRKPDFNREKSGFDRKPDFNREKSGFDRKPDFNREKSGFDRNREKGGFNRGPRSFPKFGKDDVDGDDSLNERVEFDVSKLSTSKHRPSLKFADQDQSPVSARPLQRKGESEYRRGGDRRLREPKPLRFDLKKGKKEDEDGGGGGFDFSSLLDKEGDQDKALRASLPMQQRSFRRVPKEDYEAAKRYGNKPAFAGDAIRKFQAQKLEGSEGIRFVDGGKKRC
jgi:hypothetical protein